MAALVAFVGFSCATTEAAIPADSERAADVRVDVKWRLDLAADRLWEMNPRELGDPVLSPGGDLLVGASNGWVYRIKTHSGDVEWQTKVGGSIDAKARLMGGNVYVGSDDGYLVVLDWREGEEIWRFETRGSVESRPTVADGRVFFTDSDDYLYAVDATTGELLWDYQREAPDFFTIKGGGEPLVVGDRVFCGFADGSLNALYADTGEEIWSTQLGDDVGEFGDIDLPLILDDDRLIAVSHSGGVYSVEPETGAILWRNDVSDVAGIEMVHGWLFGARTTGGVFAMDTREGDIYWEVELPEGHAPMDVAIAGSILAVPTAHGPIYWLRVRTGETLVKWGPARGFQNAPVFDHRYGYVMSNHGYLYGFSLAY